MLYIPWNNISFLQQALALLKLLGMRVNLFFFITKSLACNLYLITHEWDSVCYSFF